MKPLNKPSFLRSAKAVLGLLLLSTAAGAQNAGKSLAISPLTGDVYVYTTHNVYNGNRVPANGMYLVTNQGVVLIDSPWDTTQFQPLLDSIKSRHDKSVVLCIATHFHEDRTGGLEYYRQQGIKTYTTKLTDEYSAKRGMKRAEFLINKDTVFAIGQHSLRAFYPGPGHSPDNIVIWLENEKILYGGCLVKSARDKNLGNLSDANAAEYANTLKGVKETFRNPMFVVPGHNDWKDPGSLEHTLKMAQALGQKTPTSAER
jgi:metallo-beta-lactamase class B